MEPNVYSPPASNLDRPTFVKPRTSSKRMLASRYKRFLAAIMDAIVLGVILLPVALYTGYFALVRYGQPPYWLMIVWSLFAVFVFVILNGKLLVNSGQTIGKKLARIKIVTTDGHHPDATSLVKRYSVYHFLGLVPFVGGLLSILNVLFVFSPSRRCWHDHIADTIVVQC